MFFLILHTHRIVTQCFFIEELWDPCFGGPHRHCHPALEVLGAKQIIVSGPMAKPSQIIPCVTQYNQPQAEHAAASASGWHNPNCEVLGGMVLIWHILYSCSRSQGLQAVLSEP